MKTGLSNAAQIALYFGVDKLRGPRAMAATVLARYAAEYRAYGWWDYMRAAHRIARRWRLGDYYHVLCHRGGDQN